MAERSEIGRAGQGTLGQPSVVVPAHDQGIRSFPRYRPLAIDPSGVRHLLLTNSHTLGSNALADGTSEASFDAVWSIAHDSRAIPSAVPSRHARYRAPAHLLIALRHRLAHETMGLRLYAAGGQHFLWDVFGVAREAGMSRGEVRLNHMGSSARRVFCVHCRTLNENVVTNIVACAGCRATLFVRDHFSRRMSAFMGVQVDSEIPGEVPLAEVLYG